MAKRLVQPPLPGMGRDAVRGKKRKSNPQPALPGMGTAAVRRKGLRQSPPAPETQQAPVKEKKVSELQQSLQRGQIPLAGMMTAGEMIRHFNMGDAGFYGGRIGEDKEPEQKFRESRLMRGKLRQSKTRMADNTHYDRSHPKFNRKKISLMDSIQRSGRLRHEPDPREAVQVLEPDHDEVGQLTRPTVIDGHHRLAVMRNLNPKQFVPFLYRKN